MLEIIRIPEKIQTEKLEPRYHQTAVIRFDPLLYCFYLRFDAKLNSYLNNEPYWLLSCNRTVEKEESTK